MAALGQLTIPVLTIDDLILNKPAAGRSQDVADAALLERVRAAVAERWRIVTVDTAVRNPESRSAGGGFFVICAGALHSDMPTDPTLD